MFSVLSDRLSVAFGLINTGWSKPPTGRQRGEIAQLLGVSGLRWDERIQAKLVALVDPQGKTAKSGTPIDYFAKLNENGKKAAQLIGTLDDTRWVCQEIIKDVRAESARVGGKCKAVESGGENGTGTFIA